jgi:hypothetical protein
LKKILRNKRGDASSLIIGLIVIIFIVAILSLVFSRFFLELTSTLKSDILISNSTNAVNTLNLVQEKTIPWLDYFFLFSFIAIIIGLIISAIYIDTHPSLMIIFIIILVVAIILGGILVNVYTEIGETEELASTYNQFTMTRAIFNNFPLIIFIVGLIVVMVLYGKGRNLGGGSM